MNNELETLQGELDNIFFINKNIHFFDIIKPHETLISEWLSFIFNPYVNGVGNKTVSLLLNSIGEYNINLDEQEFIETKIEVSTDSLRRIDILINYSNLLIVIENKIDSYENNNQTEHYYNFIESIKDNKEVIYIYLKPEYNRSVPMKLKNDNVNGFVILNYNKLLNSLKCITIDDYSGEERYKYKYLKEFIESSESLMNKENNKIEFNESVNFYVNNMNKINKILNEYKIQNELLNKKIRYDILNSESLNGYRTDDDISTSLRNYIQYYKSNWYNEKHNGIHFEIIFSKREIFGQKVKVFVVLHIEHLIGDEILNKFKDNNIIRNRSLAFDLSRNVPIKIELECDFTTIDKIDESINLMRDAICDLKDKYEKVIDDIV